MRQTFYIILFLAISFLYACRQRSDNSFKGENIKKSGFARFNISEIYKNKKSSDSLFHIYKQRLFDLIKDKELNKYDCEAYRVWWDTRLKIDNTVFTIKNNNSQIYLNVKTFTETPLGETDPDWHDTLKSSITKIINISDWNDLKILLDKTNFWSMQKYDSIAYKQYCNDCDTWSVEGFIPSTNKYHVVIQNNPNSDFKNICAKFIDLYGKIDKNNISIFNAL